MINKRQIGIYLHIPFCVKKCRYCDFLSAPSDKNTQKEYVEALKQEILQYQDFLSDGAGNNYDTKEYTVPTIFFGGGTPSVLEAKQIEEIMEVLAKTFQIEKNAEITIECNPETITREKLEVYKKIGINRLSIGVQSTNDRELRELGRIHSYEKFLEGYALARKIGFENINIDLMSALPRQTQKLWEENLKNILDLVPEPEHISAYSLIIEEGTEFYKIEKELELPEEEIDRLMYHRTKEILEEQGYIRYEISNYAKSGKECRHNQIYWTLENYLGLGIGAASYLEGTRFKNIENLQQYRKAFYKREAEKEKNIRKEVQVLTVKEKIEEFMFLGLRQIKGISKKRFSELFQIEVETIYKDKIKRGIEQGVLWEKNERIGLTERGIDVSNTVMAEFLL